MEKSKEIATPCLFYDLTEVQTRSAQTTAHQEAGISSIPRYQTECLSGQSTKWTPVKNIPSSILKLPEKSKSYEVDHSNAK